MRWLHRSGRRSDDEDLAALAAEAEAGRRAAAARGEEYAVPYDIGVRWSPGAPLPHLLSSGLKSFVAFYVHEPDPDWDGRSTRIVDPTDDVPASLALAELTRCVAVKLGPPGDEILNGHPLSERGIEGYDTYVVENSRWLAEIVEMNRVHEGFDPQAWKSTRHFLFVFHDECVEALAEGVRVETFTESMPALLARTIPRLWPETTY